MRGGDKTELNETEIGELHKHSIKRPCSHHNASCPPHPPPSTSTEIIMQKHKTLFATQNFSAAASHSGMFDTRPRYDYKCSAHTTQKNLRNHSQRLKMHRVIMGFAGRGESIIRWEDCLRRKVCRCADTSRKLRKPRRLLTICHLRALAGNNSGAVEESV